MYGKFMLDTHPYIWDMQVLVRYVKFLKTFELHSWFDFDIISGDNNLVFNKLSGFSIPCTIIFIGV